MSDTPLRNPGIYQTLLDLDKRFQKHLMAVAGYSRLDITADVVVKAAALIASFLMVAGYFALLTLPVYGHDEAHYHVLYRFALIDDGRWLNYLMLDFLRRVPLFIWSVLYLVTWWALLYRLARACTLDTAFAALAASTLLAASPFLEISLWPATVVPAVSLVLLAGWMHARGIAYPVIYIVSGVLLFGALQTLYFLLPLLFAQQFLDATVPARVRLLLLFRHMLWWVGGSIAGVLVMSLMLWLLADIYFPQPAPWRNTRPVVDLASLFENIRYVATNFALWLEQLLRNGGVTWGFILTCAGVALLRARPLFAQAPALLLLLAVLISFFVFSIPYAPAIHMRSLVAMAAVVVLGIGILVGRSAIGRIIGAVLLLKMAHYYALKCEVFLENQRDETAFLLGKMQDLFPGYPMAYPALVLDGTVDPTRPEARRFNDSSLMHPVLASLGAIEVLDCRIAARCNLLDLSLGVPIAEVPFADGRLELLELPIPDRTLELTTGPTTIALIRYRAD